MPVDAAHSVVDADEVPAAALLELPSAVQAPRVDPPALDASRDGLSVVVGACDGDRVPLVHGLLLCGLVGRGDDGAAGGLRGDVPESELLLPPGQPSFARSTVVPGGL